MIERLPDEEPNKVCFIGMHPRRWGELKAILPSSTPEGERLPRFFGSFEGVSVVQCSFFPDDRVGLFDRDMLLIGWVQLGDKK